MSRAKIMILAGGTGGHVIPGLTIAKALEDAKCDITWIGTKGGIEEKLVPKANIKIEYITCLLYTSPSPRDLSTSRMPSSA